MKSRALCKLAQRQTAKDIILFNAIFPGVIRWLQHVGEVVLSPSVDRQDHTVDRRKKNVTFEVFGARAFNIHTKVCANVVALMREFTYSE